MVSIVQRMRKMHTRLLAIRLGSGALVLPKEVKRIHMRFAPKINGGHMGPRKFWHSELVRLKYHNPAVPMTVDRDALPSEPAVMSIHFAKSDAHQTSNSATSSPAPVSSTTTTSKLGEHDPTERVETIDMKNRTNEEILEDFIRITNAYQVEPTPQEVAQMQSLEEQRKKSDEDSKRGLELRAQFKREKELLEQAKGELAADEI